jgi:hypothetical protein
MSQTLSPSSGSATAVRRSTTQWLALAGIIAPILFTLIIALLDVIQYRWLISVGENPFITSPMSVNSLGPSGWLMMTDFGAFGLLVIAFAFGLHRVVKARKWAWLGIGLLIALGSAFVLCVSPCDCELYGYYPPVTLHGTIHNLGYALFVLVQTPLYLFLWRRFRKDPLWQGYAWYTLGVGVLALPVFIVCATIAPAFSWWYTWVLVFPLTWIEMVALRLWIVTRKLER